MTLECRSRCHDRDDSSFTPLRDLYDDRSTMTRILGSIGEKVGEYLGQPHRIGRDDDRLELDVNLQVVLRRIE